MITRTARINSAIPNSSPSNHSSTVIKHLGTIAKVVIIGGILFVTGAGVVKIGIHLTSSIITHFIPHHYVVPQQHIPALIKPFNYKELAIAEKYQEMISLFGGATLLIFTALAVISVVAIVKHYRQKKLSQAMKEMNNESHTFDHHLKEAQTHLAKMQDVLRKPQPLGQA